VNEMKLLRKKSPAPEIGHIDIDGQSVAVRFRINARARRMILRVDAKTGEAVVTLPPRSSRDMALEFVRDRAHWIAEQRSKSMPMVSFENDMRLPLLGIDHIVRHQPEQRTPVLCKDGEIWVGGKPEHLPRRLVDWLKKQARTEIECRVHRYADRLQRKHGRITIRDTRSRWGSCSSTGALNFSWRLILAPEWVLDYVVAHEVAHLVEHNHSAAFWAIVARLNDDAKAARKWLLQHGEGLHRYG